MRATIAVLAVLAADARSAEACSCEREAPCEAYWEADVVFVGTVTSHKNRTSRTETINGKKVTIIDDGSIATLDVGETFRGTLGKTVTIETSGSCSFMTWVTGEKFFIYAKRDGNRLVTGSCSRSDRIEVAEDDLVHARSHPDKATLGFVQGVVNRPADNNILDATTPVPDVLVKVRGLPKAVTKTNANGAFKIPLPPGDHQLDIMAPGFRLDGPPPTAKIVARGACALVAPRLVATGVARGLLVDHEGKPAANVRVVVRNAARKWHRDAATGADGRFEISDILPAMQFVLSVSAPADGGPRLERPIPTRYYPAATTETGAKVITLPATGIVAGLDFALAAPLRVIESTGTVKHRRHRLRAAYVVARSGTNQDRVDVDERGRFKVRHFPGVVTFEACSSRGMSSPDCKTVERKLEAPGKVDIVLP
ncbi:MAG TPA: hypothetical protein VIU61_18890 [Kofleriaceae bacterium]